MQASEIQRRLQELREADGRWNAHYIHLGDDIYTMTERAPGHDFEILRVTQVVADIVRRPLKELRVLDLGSNEGLYGIEFARHGAEVVGIEGRAANLRKATLAKEALGLQNITFVQDDVRNLSPEKYGRFDVVLCLGLLYHLGLEDVPPFVHKMASVCDHVTVIHTQIGMKPTTSTEYKGHTYRGRLFLEYLPNTSREAKEKAIWASLDNEKSLWLTRSSLFNLLGDAGYTSAMEVGTPHLPSQLSDQGTFVAVKGTRQQVLCIPPVNELGPPRRPERLPWRIHPGQMWYYGLARRFSHLIPGRDLIKRLLGLDWHKPHPEG